jgi:hypothetical protein
MRSIYENRKLTNEEINYILSRNDKPKELTRLLEELILVVDNSLNFIIPKELFAVSKKYPSIIRSTSTINFCIIGNPQITINMPKSYPYIQDTYYGIIITDYLDLIPDTYKTVMLDLAIEYLEKTEEYKNQKQILRKTLEKIKTQELCLYYPEQFKFLEELFNLEKEYTKDKLDELKKEIKETIF